MSEDATPYGSGLVPEITNASVKVMRSHDYCHFEVQLSSGPNPSYDCVDALRKTAARLVDKAVHQYKQAKAQLELQERHECRDSEAEHARKIEELPEGERTPQQQAELKEWKDRAFRASRRFDYQDDWED